MRNIKGGSCACHFRIGGNFVTQQEKKQQIMIVTLHSRGTDKYFSTSINAYFVEIKGYIICVLAQHASSCLYNGNSPSNI